MGNKRPKLSGKKCLLTIIDNGLTIIKWTNYQLDSNCIVTDLDWPDNFWQAFKQWLNISKYFEMIDKLPLGLKLLGFTSIIMTQIKNYNASIEKNYKNYLCISNKTDYICTDFTKHIIRNKMLVILNYSNRYFNSIFWWYFVSNTSI